MQLQKRKKYLNKIHTMFHLPAIRMNKQKHKAFDKDEKKTKSDSTINMHKW